MLDQLGKIWVSIQKDEKGNKVVNINEEDWNRSVKKFKEMMDKINNKQDKVKNIF